MWASTIIKLKFQQIGKKIKHSHFYVVYSNILVKIPEQTRSNQKSGLRYLPRPSKWGRRVFIWYYIIEQSIGIYDNVSVPDGSRHISI